MGGKHKIKDNGHAIQLLANDETYGGHSIYVGIYETRNGGFRKWTQLGDSNEDNGCPSADIVVENGIIELITDDSDFNATWKLPLYVKELEKISEQIDVKLDEYYGQWVEQPRFIRRNTDDIQK